ncbi:hypothetical protein PR202_ga05824 [Eleusine coracana subsp. coracana]|uniref:AB hydrolase-1 domain-containing protein n=1 Tax=Eleusine coracana subsp. coracana TaxID=191504 RepID=A0AAV5BTV0_ELECO|nr:hypothetical protein PR202_ga05824 [Eleusine coracana subsp. coracana]
MPYCEVDRYQTDDKSEGVRLFYRRYGGGSTKVLLIIGLAGTHDSWGPQIKGLTGSLEPADDEPTRADEEAGVGAAGAAEASPADGEADGGGDGIEVCCFDNRGVGRSSIPPHKSYYSTAIMARDALALMDHLGWKKAHVFGHSMGAMIACKLAAMAPHRLCSLALLNVTGGGFECFPKVDGQMLSLAFRFLRARTPEQRALVDLETHYTKEYLEESVGSCTRRMILYQEYVKGISSTGMQSNCGFEGQVNACWTHKMTTKELDTIRSAGFLISVIHGRYDIIAQLCHARRLAERLLPAAKMVELHGAHLVSHERPDEVNCALMDLIKATKSNMKPEEWSSEADNASETEALISARPITVTMKTDEGANVAVAVYNLLGKLQLSFLYLIGLIVMGFEHMRNIVRVMKPVRVAAIES